MFRPVEVDLDTWTKTFCRKTDILQINGQPLTASGKPLFCLFRLTAEAPHCEPELRRMVRNSEMNGLECDEVTKHEFRHEDKPPVEREVSLRGTVPPLRPLPHDVDPLRVLS